MHVATIATFTVVACNGAGRNPKEKLKGFLSTTSLLSELAAADSSWVFFHIEPEKFTDADACHLSDLFLKNSGPKRAKLASSFRVIGRIMTSSPESWLARILQARDGSLL
jgi:hypothetical protein